MCMGAKNRWCMKISGMVMVSLFLIEQRVFLIRYKSGNRPMRLPFYKVC